MKAEQGCLTQMMQAYETLGGNLIASESAPADQLHRYGVLALAGEFAKAQRIQAMIEKPKPGEAPSDQIVSGRYILQPGIFEKLRNTFPGAGGEIQLTDAMIALLKDQPFHAVRYEGQTFDCGNQLGYVLANLAYGMDHGDIAAELGKALLKLTENKIQKLKLNPSYKNTAQAA